MVSKQEIYMVAEEVRELGLKMEGVGNKLGGKVDGVVEVLKGLRISQASQGIDVLEGKLEAFKLKVSLEQIQQQLGRIEAREEWVSWVEVFGAGFHQPVLALLILMAASFKGDPIWMLAACTFALLLSPYLTVLWVFMVFGLKLVRWFGKCRRVSGIGGAQASGPASPTSGLASSFLSGVSSKLPTFSMPSFSFSGWRSARPSASTTEGDVESPNLDTDLGVGEESVELGTFSSNNSPPITSSLSFGKPQLPIISQPRFQFPPILSRPVEHEVIHV